MKLSSLSDALKKIGQQDASKKVYQLSSIVEKEELPFEKQYQDEIKEFDKSLDKEEFEYINEFPIETNISKRPDEVIVNENTNNQDIRPLIQQLRNNNFAPLASEKYENGIIGAGYYGLVFQGTYQGKNAVAKISDTNIDGRRSNESNNWKKIIRLKNSGKISQQYLKHIPNIYLIKNIEITQLDNDGNEYSKEYDLIIMEKLYPVFYAKDLLFSGTHYPEQDPSFLSKTPRQLLNTLKSYNYIYELSKKLAKVIKLNEKRIISPNVIFKRLSESKTIKEMILKLSTFGDNYANDFFIHDYLPNLTNEIIMSLPWRYTNNKLFEIIKNVLAKNLIIEIPYKFESSAESAAWKVKFKELPETSSFVSFLEELADNGVYYMDLHPGNVMMDKDGNLKIIDVGLYSDTEQL